MDIFYLEQISLGDFGMDLKIFLYVDIENIVHIVAYNLSKN